MLTFLQTLVVKKWMSPSLSFMSSHFPLCYCYRLILLQSLFAKSTNASYLLIYLRLSQYLVNRLTLSQYVWVDLRFCIRM